MFSLDVKWPQHQAVKLKCLEVNYHDLGTCNQSKSCELLLALGLVSEVGTAMRGHRQHGHWSSLEIPVCSTGGGHTPHHPVFWSDSPQTVCESSEFQSDHHQVPVNYSTNLLYIAISSTTEFSPCYCSSAIARHHLQKNLYWFLGDSKLWSKAQGMVLCSTDVLAVVGACEGEVIDHHRELYLRGYW